jgi:hypothetical protein
MEKRIIRGTSDYIHNTISIYNNGKEKNNSYEARFHLEYDYDMCLTLVGYGQDEEEALKELYANYDILIMKLKKDME